MTTQPKPQEVAESPRKDGVKAHLALIVERYNAGATMDDIAAEIGCTRPRIGQILKDAGVPRRAPPATTPVASLAGEEWRPVEGWPYEVSNLGRVRRTVRYGSTNLDGLVKLTRCSGGYPGFSLAMHGKKQTALVHDLVAKAFLGPRPSLRHLVAHFDGTRDNNRLENLRWATFEENEDDKRRHGTRLDGERNHQAKCNPEIVREIRSSPESMKALAARFGISVCVAWKIRKRQAWKHVE